MTTLKTYSINLTSKEWGYIEHSIQTQFRVDAEDLFEENTMALTDAECEGLDEDQQHKKWEDKMNAEADWTADLMLKIDKCQGKQNKEFNQMRKELREMKKKEMKEKELAEENEALKKEMKEKDDCIRAAAQALPMVEVYKKQNEQLKKQIDKQHEEIQQIKDLVALLNKKH